jgi:hypothetical protein
MGNMLRSLFENKGNVISDQVVQSPQLLDVDNTDLNRFFDASNAPQESNELVVERPNVIMIQPTKNGGIDEAIQKQYDRIKNDLYANAKYMTKKLFRRQCLSCWLPQPIKYGKSSEKVG